MLLIILLCATLYLRVVTANETTTEDISEFTTKDFHKNQFYFTTQHFINPVKKIFQDIDGRIKRLGVNKSSEDLLNAGPSLYDYPEVWWTTTTTTRKETLRTANIFHKNPYGIDVTTKPADRSFKLQLPTEETLKPTILKKHIKVVKTINKLAQKNGTNQYFKIRVKKKRVTPKTTTTINNTVKEEETYLFIINRDDKKGDLSIDANSTNIAVDLRQNDDKSGMHATIKSAFLVDKDVNFSEFDYVIHVKRKKNITSSPGSEPDMYDYLAYGDNKNGDENEEMIIKVLKSGEVSKGLELLQHGAEAIIGPEATGQLAKVVKKGLYNKNKITSTITTTVSIPKNFNQVNYPYNQNRNPNLARNQNFNGNSFNKNLFKRNPNFPRYPNYQNNPNNQMNSNYPNNPYNGNKNFIRNQFNQNRNVERNYPNGNNFNRNPNYYQNNNFNRNPNQNPNYNPNVYFNRNPYMQNTNFNQNSYGNFNGNPQNFNNRGPYQNGNFYRNQNGNFNPTNNKFNSIHKQAYQGNKIYGHASPPTTFEQNYSPINNVPIYPSNNKFNSILNQAYPGNHATPAPTPESNNPLDNVARQVEVTTEPVDTAVTMTGTESVITAVTPNGTEPVITALTTISETPDPHIDPEAYLPALYGDLGLLESGKVAETTTKTEQTTYARTATSSTTVLTTAAPLTIVVTMKGGPGPAMATTPPHFEIPPVTLRPFIQEQTDLMKELKSGYFSAAMVGLFDSLATKDPKHARVLFRSVNNEFENMVKYDKIYELGRPLFDAMDKFCQLVTSAPVDALQAYCKILHHAMFTRRQTVTADINSVIDYIDRIFNEDDGMALFVAVEKIHNYPNVTVNVEKLLRDFTDALFHPLIRYHGHAQERVLLDSLNKLIDNHIHAPHAKRRFKSHEPTVAANKNNKNFKIYNTAKTIIHSIIKFGAINKKIHNSKTTNTITTNLRRKKQQRFIVRGAFNSAQKLSTNTQMQTIKRMPIRLMTKTTPLKQLIRDTTKKGKINNNKSHHKKYSLKEHIKLKHPELYKKYFKKNRKHNKSKRHKKQKKSHKQHYNTKISKTDKLLLKYKIMKREYQKLLKNLTAFDKLKDHMNSTRVDSALVETSRTVVTKSPINFLAINLPAYKKRTFSRIQKWLPVKAKPINEETLSVPINRQNKNKFATDDSEIMSKKFYNFNNSFKKKPERFDNSNVEDTSYSNDEEVLKFKINDEIKLDRHHLNARRHGSDTTTHRINKLSSYSSSEEILLKSKIYKELLSNVSSESNSDVEIDVYDKKKLKDSFKRVLSRRNNVRSISVYSDDEDLLRKKLNV